MISTVKDLQKKLGDLYLIEKSYELIRQRSIELNTDDASLKNLVNSLSICSMEQKLVLEEVFKNFKG